MASNLKLGTADTAVAHGEMNFVVIHKTRKPDAESDPDNNAWRDIIVYSLCLSTCFLGIVIYFVFGGGKDFISQLKRMNREERTTGQESGK